MPSEHPTTASSFSALARLLRYARGYRRQIIAATMNDDVNQLERFLDGGANAMIQVLVTVVAVGAVFFVLSPRIAVLAFTPIPLIIWGAFYFQRKAGPLYADVREKVGDLSSRLTNNLGGIATIKSFTAERREAARLRESSEAYVEANRRAIRISSAFIPVIRMAILAGFDYGQALAACPSFRLFHSVV